MLKKAKTQENSLSFFVSIYPLLTMYNTPHAGYFATFLCRRPCLASARLRPSSSKIAKISRREVGDF